MLHDFLLTHEKEILALAERKARELREAGPTSRRLDEGLPIFYHQLVESLRASEGADPGQRPAEATFAASAARHGAELFRLGYPLSHVVRAYGSICQAINELAVNEAFGIAPTEFQGHLGSSSLGWPGVRRAFGTGNDRAGRSRRRYRLA